MIRQLPLLVPGTAGEYPALYGGAPPNVEQDTSRLAAQTVRVPSAKLRERVLDALRLEPRTCDELEAALGLPHQTVGPRIRELVQLGQVRDAGVRRPTRSGRGAIVWSVA